MQAIIYMLIDPVKHEVRYIGKTQRSLKERLKEHRNVAQGGRRALRQRSANWLRSLYMRGMSPDVEILEVVAAGDDWVESEQFWIAYWRAIGADLTNHTAGGDGLIGMKRPPDVIEKVRAAHIGRKLSEESKERMSKAWTPERKAAHSARRKGAKMSEAQKVKLSAAHINKRLSEDHKKNISLGGMGKILSAECKEKISKAWTPERRARQAEIGRSSVITRLARLAGAAC